MAETINVVVQKNIRRLLQLRRYQQEKEGVPLKISDAVTRFAGSFFFLGIHAVMVVFWFVANNGLVPGIPAWDPYPYVMLAMAASVEAIFLSTFVLISQNRQAELAERRAELDLQMNLLTEHEVTRLIQMVDRICAKLEIEREWDDLEQLKQEVAPDRVLVAIEEEMAS